MDILFDTEYFIHASAICLQITLKYLVDIRYGIWAKMHILFKITYLEYKKITKILSFCVSNDVADSIQFWGKFLINVWNLKTQNVHHLAPKLQNSSWFYQLIVKTGSINTKLPIINPKIEIEVFWNLLKISLKIFLNASLNCS